MSTHTALAAGFHQLESSDLPFTSKLRVVALNGCQTQCYAQEEPSIQAVL